MEQTPSSTTQLNCQWCTKPIAADALRCTSCGKLRKEIYMEKIKCYVLCALGGLLIGIGFSQRKKSNQNPFENFYYTEQSSGSNTTMYVLLVLGILAALGGIYYYVRVSQKLKTWVWM